MKQEQVNMDYEPQPVIMKKIPKKDGKSYRNIYMASESDKEFQKKRLLPLLNQHIEPILPENVFAYRKGVSIEDVVTKLETLIDDGYKWVVKLDIKSYFDCIDRVLLYEKLKQVVPPHCLLETQKCLEVPFIYRNEEHPKVTGIYQGIPISSVLANLFLIDLDVCYLGKNDVYTIRYSDDILILAKGGKKADKAYREIKRRLRDRGLGVKQARKSNMEEIATTFLGLRISKKGGQLEVKASHHAEEALVWAILNSESEEAMMDAIRTRIWYYTIDGRYPEYYLKAKDVVIEWAGYPCWKRIERSINHKPITNDEWEDILRNG
jgi:hypothetical protein